MNGHRQRSGDPAGVLADEERLYRIALDDAQRHASRKPSMEALSVEGDMLEGVSDLRRAPAPQASQHDVPAALERAVRALPVNYRAPLVLRDVEGLSTRQAAGVMGLREPRSSAGCTGRALRW